MPSTSTIRVVDNDHSVREAVLGLLRAAGLTAEAFASAEELLSSGRLDGTSCLVTDVRMPGMTGIELQQHLVASGRVVPVVYMTGYGDADARARALELGGVECLRKPFTGDALLDAVAKAIGTG